MRYIVPKKVQLIVYVGSVLAATPAFASTTQCDLHQFGSSRELHQYLSLRAVEVVKRASGPDADLAAMVAPNAMFSLGAGDVSRPLGTGIEGARELARTMKADTYRFLGWDYMDKPPDACSKSEIEVEVEFIDSQGKHLSRVKFRFETGQVRLVGAVGWERSFVAGWL